MKFYPTRKSLDSAIEIIERTDVLLGGNVRVTDSHKVFRSVLVPAVIGIILSIAAAVCLALFIHPAAGIAAGAVFTYIVVRIRNKRLHLQRIIVYCRAVERRTTIGIILNDDLELKGSRKKKYEAALGDTDPGVRKAELEKADVELHDIVQMLAHDIV